MNQTPEHPLWFFWGQKHMTFLRYMALRSACAIHADVRLILRDQELRPAVRWAEDQDFRHGDAGRNWYEEAMRLPLRIVPLAEVAPDLAALRADDVHTSDLLSWWLMATQGGTVCDMDIVFLKPLPPILHEVEVVVHDGRKGYVPIAYMQGRPNPKWTETYEKALAAYSPDVYQSCGGENLRPWPEPKLSPYVVYPWVGAVFLQILNYCFEAKHWPPLPDGCIGIHWYGGGTQQKNQRIQSVDDLTTGAVAWAVKEVLSR